jgi:hypothetical protein
VKMCPRGGLVAQSMKVTRGREQKMGGAKGDVLKGAKGDVLK